MPAQTFLFEIGCEELPVSAQSQLPIALETLFSQALADAQLSFRSIKTFATPRRLAIAIDGLPTTQAPQTIERQGPAVQAAFDKDGTPTLVCLGFAKSCGVSVDQLIQRDTPKGKRVVCICEKPGQATQDLLPELIQKISAKLPLSKPMRWSDKSISFIRPVHWIVALFGDAVINVTVFDIQASRETFGHRFIAPRAISLAKAEDYSHALSTRGYVIPDPIVRKSVIEKQIKTLMAPPQSAIIDSKLLDEVTGLVEWPVALKGEFDNAFLSVPKECLMTSMQTHQKCFPVVDAHQQLLPYFILVSNIESKQPKTVIEGNQRVIRARLSDAAFFYKQDCKKTLSERTPELDHVIFQDQLGNMGEKTERITKLAKYIAEHIHANTETTIRAAALSKCDLLSEMVSEFPDLQGIMGYYYALREKESEKCATAIREHYYPRFSGDQLPSSKEGACIAIADRVDTLVGTLGIGKIPTGDKDPFGLRRAALGIVRIMIEANIDINLESLLEKSKKLYGTMLTNSNVSKDALEFIVARLKAWYLEKNVSIEIFESVLACNPPSLVDFNKRIKAVLHFQTLPEAISLAAANKRVNNILKKQKQTAFKKINDKLFEFDAERDLEKQLSARKSVVDKLYEASDYEKALTELSVLKTPVDTFFDQVMIMVDDEKKKENRLALLASIRELMTKVADISLLPS